MFKKLLVLLFILILSISLLNSQELNEVKRLTYFGKVWGYLKYYHPEIKRGAVEWDQVFLKYYEKIKQADSYDSFNREITDMIKDAGLQGAFELGLPENGDASPGDDFSWIEDSKVFNENNSLLLKILKISRLNSLNGVHYYVRTSSSAGNPEFGNEKKYDDAYPSEALRVLALYRYWSIIEYFFPYKSYTNEDWNSVLTEYIPLVQKAGNALEYHLLVRKFTARIYDSHSFMFSTELQEYYGTKNVPYDLKDVEGESMVVLYYGKAGEDVLKKGDIIKKINGENVDVVRTRIREYVAGSNESVMKRNINRYLLAGSSDTVQVTVDRGGREIEISCPRLSSTEIVNASDAYEAAKEKWRIMDGNIGYVDMGILTQNDVVKAMATLKDTKGIVFDIRNYPKNTLYKIGEYLFAEKTPFCKFTGPDLTSPGTFKEIATVSAGKTNSDNYKGKVVVLMDETSQSHAEFTIMMFQALPGCTVIGSQTAGADGNVSRVWLPGKIRVFFTGLGVYYPDGGKTQRVGLKMDIELKPTVAGIRAGRDELLERAIEVIGK